MAVTSAPRQKTAVRRRVASQKQPGMSLWSTTDVVIIVSLCVLIGFGTGSVLVAALLM